MYLNSRNREVDEIVLPLYVHRTSLPGYYQAAKNSHKSFNLLLLFLLRSTVLARAIISLFGQGGKISETNRNFFHRIHPYSRPVDLLGKDERGDG